MAAAVHHGAAGTTKTAAAAGTPQVIVPRTFDQSYFADRVERLGIGIGLGSGGAHRPPSDPSGDSSDSTRVALHHALHEILDPDVAATAHAVASTWVPTARRSPRSARRRRGRRRPDGPITPPQVIQAPRAQVLASCQASGRRWAAGRGPEQASPGSGPTRTAARRLARPTCSGGVTRRAPSRRRRGSSRIP
ncbi:MAG: nucleotide disphospho-sugar-binding domain-containing protein [Kineosporiaceae bacterium]